MPPINAAGLQILEESEGCKLTAYQDPVGVWTIGYGDTQNVTPGMTITQSEADQRLRNRLPEFEVGVNGLLARAINSNQFSALVDFAYNLGLEALRESTLLKMVNEGDFAGAANEFGKWVYAGDPPQALPGLVERRAKERTLFLEGS